MTSLVGAAFARRTAVVMILVMILVAGAVSYVTIPKEAAPEVEIPLFTISLVYSGISAEDSARLLVRPMERQLQGIAGLRRMSATAGEGFATIQLEFDPGGDNREALIDVRDRVELARADLPPGAEEPRVTEVDISLFPVFTATLSGPVPERTLAAIARALRDRIEGLPGVLEVDIVGTRDDLVEIVVDPVAVESYRLAYEDVVRAVERNNRLIAAGTLATGAGRIPIAIPGVIEDIDDLLDMAVLVRNGTVVRIGDIADVRLGYHDPSDFARIDGDPSIALEIRKAAGANIIDTVAAARGAIEDESADWPETIAVNYLQDQAADIADLLGDLESNVVAAILLVMLIIVLVLGVGASIIVAVAIPGAFLTGVLAIHLGGLTLNIVVLFALILVIGMLVDGAIVVVELASRNLVLGMNRRLAFEQAAKRMAWPITSSIATTLAVFVPLLLWPGTAGQFMRFLPITVLVTLLASLLMALVFVPVLGSLLPRRRQADARPLTDAGPPEPAPDEPPAGWFTGRYLRALDHLLRRPGLALVGTVGILVVVAMLYQAFGRGIDFFPAVEPQFAQVQLQTQGNLSIQEADALVRRVEDRLLDLPDVRVVYTRTIGTVEARMGANLGQDVIGTIQLDLVDWRERRPASLLLEELRGRLDIPGVAISLREQDRGPGTGLPIEIEVAAGEAARILPAVDALRALMEELGGFVDVTDDRPLAGVELRVAVNREEAARYGADVAMLGNAVQLLTTGVLLGSYRPDFTEEEVEIRLRYPAHARDVGRLAHLRVLTPAGLVPIANFVSFEPAILTGIITRVDGRRVHRVSADVASGALVAERLTALQEALDEAPLDPAVSFTFRGQAEDQAEAGTFLIAAFAVAVFSMLLILVIQFNSLFQAGLVLSAIVFSTAGVLLGLMIRQEPFGIVMSGMGVIALAGIVVNNNIVLIDAYNEHRAAGLEAGEAARRAGADRLRPVLLTAITTLVGLTPMAMGLTVDFPGRDLYFGAPSTQYWIQLATAIMGGLAIATLITLFFTPPMLAWRDRRSGGRAASTS